MGTLVANMEVAEINWIGGITALWEELGEYLQYTSRGIHRHKKPTAFSKIDHVKYLSIPSSGFG